MDIKHILEKLSEIDTKHTLLESAPAANITPRPVVDIGGTGTSTIWCRYS